MEKSWTPDTWRQRPAAQQPAWPDETALHDVLTQLAAKPPLVFAGEARSLQEALARVAMGEAFLLQAGDCAESFKEFSASNITDRLKVILQMAAILTYGTGVPVVKVGRIAGQFAKPRSQETEVVNGIALPTFRGHIVHDDAPTPEARVPDPTRMMQAYNQSAATLNLLRAFTKGGYADLHQVHAWNQEFLSATPGGQRYEQVARDIHRAIRFMEACGMKDVQALRETEFWTSHEALLLGYEEALTRRDALTGQWYATSAHLLWLGDRTRQLGGAHVEYLSGVKNPLGVKVGPTITVDELLALCDRLDPARDPGRLLLISRMGASRVTELLPPLLAAVRESGHPVAWACDPMHGNTFVNADGHKTRHFEDVVAEVGGFFQACERARVWPGGIHVELTGDDVTECLGGTDEITDERLGVRYTTTCDPRLNGRQSVDLAFRVVELLQK
jgi:3-deoxy-7-phosphoheptulonate synthase